jgi:pimeloyl-ACP methyl ester carboxylesterase
VRGPVTSPTFVIARVHPSLVGGPALVHVDAYRLGSLDEVDDLDLLITRLYSFASPVPPSVVDFTAEVLASTPIETVAAFMPEFGRHDRLTALAAYDECEALVIVGDRDLLTPPEHSEDILRRLPHAEHVVVPRSGHMLLMEHPDIVNAALRELLARAQRLHRARQGTGGRAG